MNTSAHGNSNSRRAKKTALTIWAIAVTAVLVGISLRGVFSSNDNRSMFDLGQSENPETDLFSDDQSLVRNAWIYFGMRRSSINANHAIALAIVACQDRFSVENSRVIYLRICAASPEAMTSGILYVASTTSGCSPMGKRMLGTGLKVAEDSLRSIEPPSFDILPLDEATSIIARLVPESNEVHSAN